MYLQSGEGLGWFPGTAIPKIYKRDAAIDYAHRHWNVPCNDRFIALRASPYFAKVPAGTKFIHEFDGAHRSLGREHALRPDGTRIEWQALDDCTHFISCCIGQPPGETAGGIPIIYRQLGSPPSAPYGIVRVGTMVDYLLGKKYRGREYADAFGKEKTNDDSIIRLLDPGDLIAYWNIEKKLYTHLTMYLGNGKIGCHTYCRFDDPACTWDNNWDLGRGTHLWTPLHLFV
jgi:hypothetical protein